MSGTAHSATPSAPANVDLIFGQLDALGSPDRAILRLLDSSTQKNERDGLGDDARMVREVMRAFGGNDAVRRDTFDCEAYWRHCVAVGGAARRIAAAIHFDQSGVAAFGMGLLHNVGQVAMAAAMPKAYARVLRESRGAGVGLLECERRILGIDHCTAGRRVLERWGLPARFVECAWLHHLDCAAMPASVAAGRHVFVVQLAHAIVCESGLGSAIRETSVQSSAALGAMLGMAVTQVHMIAEAVGEEAETLIARAKQSARTPNDSASNESHAGEREQLSILLRFATSISSHATLGQVCELGAAAIRETLGKSAVVVLVVDAAGRSKIGVAGESSETRCREVEANDAIAESMRRVGRGIAEAPRAFDGIVDQLRGVLGSGDAYLFPLVCETRSVGVALFVDDENVCERFRTESHWIELLSATIGTCLAQARERDAANRLLDEVTEGSRRGAGAQADVVRDKTLETVVTMAAGAAHELNNPLAVISGRAQMLAAQTADPGVQAGLDTIMRKAQECSDIVTDLMEFAQPRQPRAEAVDLHAVLEAVRIELISQRLLEPQQVVIDTASDRPKVWFDRDQLSRLFRELLLNGIEATNAAERLLTVKVVENVSEKACMATVEDNGRGMTADVLARAFDPFFSHRPAGRGRGLGLARAKRYVLAGGGQIRMESGVDRGTRVELRLPTTAPGE